MLIRVSGLAVVIAAAVCAPAFAQSAFTGTWKIDIDSYQLPDKPIVRTVANGIYECLSCAPPYKLPADGRFHPIAGYDEWDEASVEVVDARTVRAVFRRGGRVVSSYDMTVSPDGQSLISSRLFTGVDGAEPIRSEMRQTRVAPAPPGSHPVSGSWRRAAVAAASESARTATVRREGDRFEAIYPSGEAFTATLGGPPVPLRGASGVTVTAEAAGERTIIVTNLRGDRVLSVETWTVTPDGRTLELAVDNRETGGTTRFRLTKQ